MIVRQVVIIGQKDRFSIPQLGGTFVELRFHRTLTLEVLYRFGAILGICRQVIVSKKDCDDFLM